MAKGKKKVDKTCKILELPDCVLRILFSYLDNTSLFLLSRTCRYFQYFVEDPVFWRYIDAKAEPNSTEKVHYCSDRIHEKTTHIFLKAKDKNCGQVPANFFDIISPFKHLRVLALENQRFNGSKLSLKDFPTCLEELSLKKTHIKSSEHFFQHSNKRMQNLKVLILDGCKWVTCSFLMSVTKYENLEIISAVKCLRLHLNMVPYLNVARAGCEKLKIFDCRFTGIGHELLRTFYPKESAFYPKESIQSLYFQSLKTAELDYGVKVFNNNYMRSVTYPTEDNHAMDGNVCDASLIEYINSIASDNMVTACDSVLYQDPYPKCTCNYKSREHETKSNEPEILEDYYLYEPPRRQLRKFVCQKHFKDVQKLPIEFKDFFVANEKQFYTGINSDAESDADSSDSDNDNTCCMYGMGRRMVLLTPGNNHESVHEETVELARDDRRDRLNVSIFIASPLGEGSTNPQREGVSDVNAIPSTSRSVSENSINENIENSRNEAAKRRHSGEGEDHDDSQQNKRAKASDEKKDDTSDKAQEAQVNELVESAAEIRNRLNKFIRNSMDKFNNRPARLYGEDSGPSTSRVENPAETVNGNMRHRFQDAQTKVCVIIPPKSDAHLQRVNRSTYCPARSVFREYNHNLQLSPESVARLPTCNGNHVFSLHHCIHGVGTVRYVRPQHIVSRPVNRFVNPLFIQVQNKQSKKKLSLRRLSLRGFKRITDVALDYIKNLNIDLLDVTFTSVTKEGIENFLIHNPSCRVVHPLYCVCTPINPF